MSSIGSLPELDALRSQVADLSRQLAERDRSSRHQREQSDLLRAILEGTAAETGDAFFSALVTHLTSVLHVKYALIGEVQGDHIKKIRTLAVSAGGVIVDNFEYALAHTPCASTLTQSFACFDRNLQTMFPQFVRLADLGAESYCAVPLRTKGGAVMGLLVVMDTKPLQQGDDLQALLEVFAPRVAAEFERRRAEQERAQALADLHNVIETIPDIVFALDTQGNVLKWNRRLGDVTGYSSEELLNKPALAFVPPEEQARTAAAIQRVFMEGYAELEGHLLTKEHHLIPYHWAGALLKNSHGEPIGITGIGRDVGEKTQAEAAFRASEERYRALYDETPTMYFTLAVDGTVCSVNRFGAEQLGYQVEELVGHSVLDIFHEADKETVAASLSGCFAAPEATRRWEGRKVRKDGTIIWVREAAHVGQSSSKSPIVLVTCEDITERKRMEEALRESQERFSLAADGSTDALWDAHPIPGEPWYAPRTPIWWSSRVRELLGLQESESFETLAEWAVRLHPDDKDGVFSKLAAHIEHRVPYDAEYRLRTNHGDYRWIRGRGQARWNELGRPVRMSGSCQDITERKQAEAALRESEERYRTLVDLSPSGVIVYSNGRNVYVNQAACTILGADSPEQLLDNLAFYWSHPDAYESIHASISRILETGELVRRVERKYQKVDGTEISVEVDAGRIMWNGEPAVQVIFADITERKQAERLVQHRLRFERLIASLSTHFINLPSSGIDGGINQALCSIGQFTGADRSYVFLFRDGGRIVDNSHEWCADGIVPQIDNLQGLPTDSFPWIMARHQRDQITCLARIADLPLEASAEKEEFEREGIQSLVAVPIVSPRGVIGFVGFDLVRNERTWDDDDIALLKIFGELLAGVIERKRAEEELRDSQEHLRQALHASNTGLWDWNTETNEAMLSKEWKRQLGYEESDLADIFESWATHLHPDDHDRAMAFVQAYLANPVGDYQQEFRLRHKDGTYRWIEARASFVTELDGRRVRLVGSHADITERKQSEAALRLAKFSVDRAADAVYWIDSQAKILDVNEAASHMLGYSRDELCAMTVHDLNPDFQTDMWPGFWAETQRLGTMVFETVHRAKNGRLIPIEVSVNYLSHEGKEYHCAFVRNITERKRADVALRVSEERYRALYDETPTMCFTLATDGTVRSVNRFGAEQLGYRVEELIGHSVLGLFHEQDKEAVVAGLSECLATPAITRYWEFRKVGKDGNVIWVRETARVDQSFAEEPIVLVTCEDITEHKRAEHESRERSRQASAMQTALLELAHLDDTQLTFSKVLPQVTSIVADMLAVERVSLWLLSEDQTELVCQDLYLRGQAAHSAGSRLTASSYPRYLAVLKESLVIAASHARVDQRTSEFADDYFSSLGITSVLDVPICRQGKLVGVLWCEHVGAAREWAHEAQDFAASVGQTIVRMIEAAERKRAEMSLRQSEERYRSLVDNAPIGIFVNKAGQFAYANRELQRILNATRVEQLLGMPVLDRIAPEFHTVVKDRIHQLMEKGQPVPSLDEQYVRLDGSRVDVSVTAIPTSFDGTDVIQVLVLDIAERKQAEQEQSRLIEDLIRSRQHFQALFNWTPSAVGISTVPEGRFIDVNEGFSRLTGYMREEVMGRTTLELGLWADVSERESVLREIREQGYLHNREGLLRTKSGEILSLMVSVESIQLGATPCLIYLCHDITERKRMEDALRARERELQAALQERERISQDLHDGILQSLFAVGLNLEVAKSFMPPRTRKTSGASLDKAIDQLNRVLREIRNFIARLDLDLFEGKDLPTALQCALESLAENQATRVRLAVEDRAAKAISVEQSLHLFYVIQEAVSNCIRHGGAQEARVSLKMLKQGVRLSIRDNGRGFNPNVAKGVGHGLANMAARAKKIGGRFTVLSKENEGTRIVLDLPKESSNVSR